MRHLLSVVLLFVLGSAFAQNPSVKDIVFVKRFTYNANHYYTEFINSSWMPGGGLFVYNTETKKERELTPSLKGGVYGRIDLSFDAKNVLFAYKKSHMEGYRIYEVGIDGSDLRQLTLPEYNEDELSAKYSVSPYHHATDDLDPCYLPDGGIAFVSTRCQYGVLCDEPDDFTVTLLHRMDGDGKNMKQLSYGALSENTPSVLPDGRILYTRWEYVDKGAVSVKCLWAMRPDGTASEEVYGNDISLPPTMIFGRAIPNASDRYVFCGTPHFPQNGVGTVIVADVSKNIRTREPMTYITPDVDIRDEGGFHFKNPNSGEWDRDNDGHGPLYRDPYPINENLFIVSHKPAGTEWYDPLGYALYYLNKNGETELIYRDSTISSFAALPVVPRKTPPVLKSNVNTAMAAKGLATLVITDVYKGMENVERGEAKYIRVMQQVPRPWSVRRLWKGDGYDQQHVVITKDTHLGLKVMLGIVDIEDDGSAHFTVPADQSIFLQVLDSNYMALQTERTFVNYGQGETRSCVGCHENSNASAVAKSNATPKALKRAAVSPRPQLGEKEAKRTMYYARDVQPVWDKHCISCHNDVKKSGDLNLSGEKTELFNISYEALVPERRKGDKNIDRGLLGPVIGENHPKIGNVHYLGARSLGSHSSILVAMLAPDKVVLADAKARERAEYLADKHSKIELTPEELLKVTTWVDTNCQYYGSWWGKRNIMYEAMPGFRTDYGYHEAISRQLNVTQPQKLD